MRDLTMKKTIHAEFIAKEEQHDYLIKQLDELKDEVQSQAEVCHMFHTIIEQVNAHNQGEEQLMREVQYDDVYPHHLAHKAMNVQLNDWLQAFIGTQLSLEELVEKSRNLLLSHIELFDRDIDWYAKANTGSELTHSVISQLLFRSKILV